MTDDTITIERKREEIAREIAVRQEVYPRWVRERKISQQEADRRIATMVAIQADYGTPQNTGPMRVIDCATDSPARPYCIAGGECLHWLTSDELRTLHEQIATRLAENEK